MCAKSLQSCSTLCHPLDCSPPGSSVYGISQARLLEWIARSSSKGSPWPRDWTRVSTLEGRFFATSTTWEAPSESASCSVVSDSLQLHELRVIDRKPRLPVMDPKDIRVLFPSICDYVTLCGQRHFAAVSRLRTGRRVVLFGWVQFNHTCPCKRDVGGLNLVKRDVNTKPEVEMMCFEGGGRDQKLRNASSL